MSRTLFSGQTINVSIGAGESITISSVSGTFTATVTAGTSAGTVLATASTGGGTYGPYASGAIVRIVAGVDSVIDFDSGITPTLTYTNDARFSTGASGNVTGLVGPGGNVLLGNRYDPTQTALMLSNEIASPLEIPNCELWLDAMNGPTTSTHTAATNGQAVATWQDNSGNARHATVAAGTPLFTATGGFGGKAGVKIGATCRMATPAFVTSGYGTNITMFIVSQEDTVLHSSLKLKASISTASFYMGNVGTTGVRDITVSGLTGFTQATQQTDTIGGIDYLSVSASQLRLSSDGFGPVGSSGGSHYSDHVAISAGAVPFTNGVVTIGGLTGSAVYDWPGAISEIILFSRALTASELRRVSAYLSYKWRSLKTVVLLGNSLVSGTGSTGGANQWQSPTGTNLPSRLIAALGTSAKVKTDAYPGRTAAQLYTETPEYSGICFDAPNTITVVWEGTNTLNTTGSISKAFDDLRRLCLQKKGIGKKVIVGTVLVRGDSGNNAKNAAYTASLNNLIRSNYATFADAVVDFAADARLQDFTNVTYFSVDTIHLNDAGYQVCADILAPVVTPYL